jgi:hypothetical protein
VINLRRLGVATGAAAAAGVGGGAAVDSDTEVMKGTLLLLLVGMMPL